MWHTTSRTCSIQPGRNCWISTTKAFNVSGTVTCGVTGPMSDVEIYVWNRDTGAGFVTVPITLTEDTARDVILPPGFTVAGCITDGTGNPVPCVQVYAYDPNIRGFGFAPSDESGCYTGNPTPGDP
jgi:protocatechuate 3,4-dioxygenase beta subunit